MPLAKFQCCAVIDLYTRDVLYSGNSPGKAAEAGKPGTCWGFGRDEKSAVIAAKKIAAVCRVNEFERRDREEEARAAG